jgi:ribonuclease-3
MSRPRLHDSLLSLYELREPARLLSVLTHSDYSHFIETHGLTLPLESLVRSFTHTSFAHEYQVAHQEQMEFLGDAVLQLILTEDLCKRFPEEKEGKLSRMRSTLVNENTLSQLAIKLSLGDLILTGKGEFKKTLQEQEAVLADTFEALISQIFRYQGLEFTSKLVLSWYQSLLVNAFDLSILESFDVKSRLQEKSLALFKKLPRYESESTGEKFEVKLWINETLLATGVFASKKNGEKELAQIVLDKGLI